MKKIVVIGSLNMDLITRTDRVPVMGETLSGLSFQTVCGGKGGNQAFAAGRLAGSVTMLGCVGNDVFGQTLIASLKSANVDCSHIRVCEGESGTASITVCQGDNSIIIIPGANGKVSIEYIEENRSLIDSADMLILQLEIPLETVEYIIGYAAAKNIPVMLNPAPAADLPEQIFKQTSYMIVNETECEFYTGTHITNIEEAKQGLTKLLHMGVKTGIVTLGSQGAVYNCGDQLFHVPAQKVTAVDSTAAGDTFTAAIAVALLEGSSVHEAMEFATKASAIVVTRMGAQTSIPDRSEIG